MSTTTGPGLPLEAIWNASCSTLGRSSIRLHQVVVLGAGPRDADRVAFLEGVVADQVRRHLPGDDHQRDGVAQCIGQAGDRVGGARAGRHQHAADLAGRARVALGRVHGALLVTHEHMLQAVRLLEQRIVDRQHGTARIAEQMLHALVGERLDHHFGAGHFLGHALLHRSSPTSLGSKVTWKQSHLESKSLGIKKGREGPAPHTANRAMA